MVRLLAFILALLVLPACAPKAPPSEDATLRTAVLDLRDARRATIPVSLFWTEGSDDAELILFSHGAFSAPEKYRALIVPLAKAGYLVAAPLHADSETWRGARPARQEDGLAWRIGDLTAILSARQEMESATGRTLADRYAAAGHSFGALAAQILGGASPGPLAGELPSSPLPPAAILAISPPGPIDDYIDAAGWRHVSVPQLVTTGTADVVPPLVTDWRQHLASYEAATAPAYLYVAEGGDHYFGNLIGRTEYPGPPQRETFQTMTGHALAFLNAYVRGDEGSRDRLASAPDVQKRQTGDPR